MKSPQPKRNAPRHTSAKKTLAVQSPAALMPNTKSLDAAQNNFAKGADDDMTDAFIHEVSEEVKNDNLKIFWDKYGLFVILFVVLAVSAAVSFETIKNWRDKAFQSRTEQYLMSLPNSVNYESSLKALEKIASGDNGIYSELARIQIANILFEQNKISEGEEMLQTIVDNDELNPRVRNLAALKLATYKIDTAPRTEIQTLLEPVANAENSWSPLAKDLLAMAAIKDGDIEGARTIYVSLLESGNISENFRSRIQDMLSALNDM